jgi:hypothetical protein
MRKESPCFLSTVKGYNKHLRDAREGGPPTSREKGGKSYRTGALLPLRNDRGFGTRFVLLIAALGRSFVVASISVI